MKVVHVISGLRGGGAEHIVLALCEQSVVHQDSEMQVVSLSGITDIADKFQNIPVFIPRITGSHKRNNSGFRTAISAIRHLLSIRPDLLHAHMIYGCMAACIVKLFRPGTKIVFTLHNTHQPNIFYRIFLFMTRPMRAADIIFPGTRPAWYQKKNATTIANAAYHSTIPENIGKDVFTCLFAGRLEKQKRPLLLPDIAGKLAGKFPFRIIVAGAGSLEQTLRNEVERRNLTEYFEWAGFTHNMPVLIARSHCLLLPSDYEGMPLIVMEAAAARLPVIATPEAVKAFNVTSEHAFICSPAEFHNAIEEVRNNSAGAQRAAENLHNKLCAYTRERSYREHLKLYASAVQ